jgi:hypothetical protein
LQNAQKHRIKAPEKQADYHHCSQYYTGKEAKFAPGGPVYFPQFHPDVMQVFYNSFDNTHVIIPSSVGE